MCHSLPHGSTLSPVKDSCMYESDQLAPGLPHSLPGSTELTQSIESIHTSVPRLVFSFCGCIPLQHGRVFFPSQHPRASHKRREAMTTTRVDGHVPLCNRPERRELKLILGFCKKFEVKKAVLPRKCRNVDNIAWWQDQYWSSGL